jgi:pimeloyl-ACP methyl ester carboxylesterase
MGGYVAIWFGLQHPEKTGSIVTLGTKFDWSLESAEKEVKKMDPQRIEEKIPAFARILEHRHQPADWKDLMNRTSSMMTQLGASPLLNKDNLMTLINPVTIALGDQDDMADREYSMQVASWLSAGQFILLENTPHPIEKVNLTVLEPLLLR